MDIEVKTINDNLITSVEKDSNKAVRKMSKKGLVTIDGAINQYNPGMARFTPANENEILNQFYNLIDHTWGLLSPQQILQQVKMGLPNITEKDANDFVKYNEQSQVIINEELIQDLLTNAINENKELQRLNDNFKGKKDIVSQITVLRNNDIFTDNKRRLFKLKDGEFLRYASNDIMGVLNTNIAADDIYFNIHEVKKNFITYNENLTDITKVYESMRIKQYKEKTLTNCKPGFEKVLKIISKYGGKK